MEILYEDNHLLAVNKAVGEIVQKDKTDDPSLIETVKAFLIRRDHRPGDVFAVPVHRLDRPTSGVVLFARTSKALSRLSLLFRENAVEKHYWAVTEALPDLPEGQCVHFLKRNEAKNITYPVPEGTRGAKRAELSYQLIASSDRYHLLDITLKTGRHHQIRAQLKAMGCPIRGDLKYGYPRSNKDGGIDLHARSLSFVHPVSRQLLTITAPPPKNNPLWAFFAEAVSH